MPKGVAEVNANRAFFGNLRATCHLFATVAAGWNLNADVI
jgi:hypothetical protein